MVVGPGQRVAEGKPGAQRASARDGRPGSSARVRRSKDRPHYCGPGASGASLYERPPPVQVRRPNGRTNPVSAHGTPL
jgi:hypothetical protein